MKEIIKTLLLLSITQTTMGQHNAPLSSDLQIPQRSETSITGSKLIEGLLCEPITKRENMIMQELKLGNIPDFLRVLKPIEVSYKEVSKDKHEQMQMTIFVMPDYLAVGTDDDFVRVPLNLKSAVELTKRWNFVLPTPKIVDLIYMNADCKIPPHPLKPGPEMTSPKYVKDHNQKVDQDTPRSASKVSLKAGHKKDVVISNRLLEKKNRIAIYGWHRLSGKPIQPLSIVHNSEYADYSHGIRLVYNKVWIKDGWVPISQILGSKELAYTLSHEGPVTVNQPLIEDCN